VSAAPARSGDADHPLADPERRAILTSGAPAALGITVLSLPVAAAAASPGTQGASAAGTTDLGLFANVAIPDGSGTGYDEVEVPHAPSCEVACG
jgi:hypothetical protein